MADSDRTSLLSVYRTAALIKAADEKLRGLLTSGELAVAYYSPRGQEVLAAATSAHLDAQDYLVTTYRGIHDQIAKGAPLDLLFAEIFGRVTGTCKGKGGPMHVTHPSTGVMVTTGIVGSGLPIAVGLATSSSIRGDGRVTVVCFGDGASNIGAFHEALNLAAVWKLPVVFVCQNNLYAESTRYADGTSAARIADRAVGYGIPGERVDGNDAAATLDVVGRAVARARAGEGPTLVEAVTYRFMGHYFGDPGAYMDADEYAAALARDPVPALRARLIADGVADEATLADIEAEATAKVEAAAAFAADSPLPGVAELTSDVYREAVYHEEVPA
ncbi:acetoin dehydrogenase E1 component (TPP-dependent alpha subunit) [Frankia canadensis]|uniref:Acetoin dehydrogenase E1 component (TPP-dependent alpha subunit) n=1 Tax=Frankia canadensis TaxID=1836972 RepID=A0A2I2L2T2_9ACTN|nr:thiamine pyrophosphate-dependent dehydrogenase E1 component subunit alpha [Frankia canadensis]SNQ52224.1 acetoin dehydrogenase E1 component (TPP-dependent alpha subunit) [Frankia canadensis]SOU59514.1 acetoin dehydrogenase E1 component (TPP-dependent alpha subunit) [Frankia canadensis]